MQGVLCSGGQMSLHDKITWFYVVNLAICIVCFGLPVLFPVSRRRK